MSPACVLPAGELRTFGNKSVGFARVIVEVGLSYEADADEVLAVLKDVATEWAAVEENRAIMLEPEPLVQAFTALGDSAVTARPRSAGSRRSPSTTATSACAVKRGLFCAISASRRRCSSTPRGSTARDRHCERRRLPSWRARGSRSARTESRTRT